MATQVIMEDGTQSPLADHMRDAHQKGTRGFTDEYLASLHRMLHQRGREAGEELGHTHQEAPPGDEGDGEVLENKPASAGAGRAKGKHRKVRI